MKIAILGGGFAGLTAAFYLRKKNHEVVLLERAPGLGGLASGFKDKGWEWPLERAYHHIFSNDSDIINFAKDTGYDKIFFQKPVTASLFKVEEGYQTFPFDSPTDLLKFPLLTPVQKIRTAAALATLKWGPMRKRYEKETTEEFLRKTMGDKVWNVLWEQLMRKKFGKYAGKVLASFFWARINKRTPDLGYMEGGFQSFIDHTAEVLREMGVEIRIGSTVETIEKTGENFSLTSHHNGESVIERFDAVISTLPTPVLAGVGQQIFPEDYIEKLKKIEYLNALCLIVVSKQPILDKTYWLNVIAEDLPLMVICQHTNFIDKKHYHNENVAYIGYYLDADDPKMKMTQEELIAYLQPHLRKIANREVKIVRSHHFRAPFAQPIFDKEFLHNHPHMHSPVKNFLIANLDMTYPYDRGTNYAVKLGREVAEQI